MEVAVGVADDVGAVEFDGADSSVEVGWFPVNQSLYRDSPSVIPSKGTSTFA
jgi:hypothetical protein